MYSILKRLLTLFLVFIMALSICYAKTEKKTVKKPIRHTVQKETSRAMSFSDRKSLTVVATAYAVEQFKHSKTATGKKLKTGIIAVDPKVIPLGTKLYIEGYGYGIANDTGGAIKGNKIDVTFNTVSECMKWGRKKVRIYILN